MNKSSLCLWAVLLAAVPAYAGTPVALYTTDTSNDAAPRTRWPFVPSTGRATLVGPFASSLGEFSCPALDPESRVLPSHAGAGSNCYRVDPAAGAATLAFNPLPETPALAWECPKRGGPAQG
jgi:hypothetical protein